MGYAVAESAINRGHQVILISGPVNLQAPENCELIKVQTAAEMHQQVKLKSKNCDAAVMVAAVADYTPAAYSEKKIKKTQNKELKLIRTKDILGSMREEFEFDGILVGFAADTDGTKMEFAAGVQKIGAINNRYTVYKNPYMKENVILMGYRGAQFLETGAVYAPYVPLIMTPLVYDPVNFTPRKGVMTRYAKKMVRPEFYGKVYVGGLNSI